MVYLPNEFVCVLLTHLCHDNTFRIYCTCICWYGYSYDESNTSSSKNISDTQYMKTLCHQHGCHCLHLNYVDLQIVHHTLHDQAILAFCSAGVYWYQLLTVLCCNCHLHITVLSTLVSIQISNNLLNSSSSSKPLLNEFPGCAQEAK